MLSFGTIGNGFRWGDELGAMACGRGFECSGQPLFATKHRGSIVSELVLSDVLAALWVGTHEELLRACVRRWSAIESRDTRLG